MVESVGADLVDLNFGCPVKKVTKTGAGATLLDDPDLACRIVEAIAAVRRSRSRSRCAAACRDGSRDCLGLGPRLVDAGARR